MDFKDAIQMAGSDPLQLEQLYQDARRQGQAEPFRAALLTLHTADPEHRLYAAWSLRLEQDAQGPARTRRAVHWTAAVPLSILTGLIFWALSDVERLVIFDDLPQLMVWWSPIATMSALVFLAVAARKNLVRGLALGLGLLAAAGYAVLLVPAFAENWQSKQYLLLAVIHIPLLSWAALGLAVLGLKSGREDRFAFLIKSIEVMITAGLYLIAGVAFGGITIGLLAALSIEPPELLLRLIAAGGFGLLPVMALASVYDPERAPSAQDFDQGLSQVIATMMRLLLPLTLVVLLIYLFIIPFNFRAPFENRDVLIVYNLMLFAILGLLVGATPMRKEALSEGVRAWLRRGILSVAALVVLISLYALSATVYRTVEGGLTLNRLTIIGWNGINIAILTGILYRVLRGGRAHWIDDLQSVIGLSVNAYIAWALFLVFLLPLLF